MVTMSPFENVLNTIDIKGKYIKEALEFGVQYVDLYNSVTSSYIFLQVSGLKIVYDFYKPVGQRVVGLKVRCIQCDYPVYEEFDEEKVYRIAGPSFLIDGGDGFSMFPQYGTNKGFVVFFSMLSK